MVRVKASETVEHDFDGFKMIEVVGIGEYHFKADNEKGLLSLLKEAFMGSEVFLIDPHGVISNLEYTIAMKSDEDNEDVISVMELLKLE
jgi:hypothetical protein